MTRRVVVGFSGGVSSAWCAGWALRQFPRDEVVLLWHDTKEEHPDTYRFLREMAAALQMPITERSDGRSVTELFRDEGYLGNNQNAMCSRILKVEQGDKYFDELRAQGITEIKAKSNALVTGHLTVSENILVDLPTPFQKVVQGFEILIGQLGGFRMRSKKLDCQSHHDAHLAGQVARNCDRVLE